MKIRSVPESSLFIRPAKKSDYDSCREMIRTWNGMLLRRDFEDYVEKHNATKEEPPLYQQFVTVDQQSGDKVVAYVRATHRKDGQTTINESLRDREYARQGLLKELFELLEKIAKGLGQYCMFTKFVDDNSGARNFLLSLNKGKQEKDKWQIVAKEAPVQIEGRNKSSLFWALKPLENFDSNIGIPTLKQRHSPPIRPKGRGVTPKGAKIEGVYDIEILRSEFFSNADLETLKQIKTEVEEFKRRITI